MKKEGYCKECCNWVEIKRSCDEPDFCPECRSVDNIDFDVEPCPKCDNVMIDIEGQDATSDNQETPNYSECVECGFTEA